MGPTKRPETSVRNCHSTLRDFPEEWRSHVLIYMYMFNTVKIAVWTENNWNSSQSKTRRKQSQIVLNRNLRTRIWTKGNYGRTDSSSCVRMLHTAKPRISLGFLSDTSLCFHVKLRCSLQWHKTESPCSALGWNFPIFAVSTAHCHHYALRLSIARQSGLTATFHQDFCFLLPCIPAIKTFRLLVLCPSPIQPLNRKLYQPAGNRTQNSHYRNFWTVTLRHTRPRGWNPWHNDDDDDDDDMK